MTFGGSGSFEQLLDDLSAARGLSKEELVQCIRDAIGETFKQKGRIVTVVVEDIEGRAIFDVQETILTGGSRALYRKVQLVPPPPPDLLARIIDEYVQKKAANHSWGLAFAIVLAIEEDHYLLEIADSEDVKQAKNKPAVLPRSHCNSLDNFAVNDGIWVAFKPSLQETIAGGHVERWRDVKTPYVATRSDPNFLTMMALRMLGEEVQGVIHTSRGIMIFPPGTETHALLADGCRAKNTLQSLCGLERLAIARRSPREEIDKRLIHAVNEVAGLKYGVDYKLSASKPDQPPVVYVSYEKAKRLMGKGGSNLFFIKCVVQSAFEVKTTSIITRPEKKASTTFLRRGSQ